MKFARFFARTTLAFALFGCRLYDDASLRDAAGGAGDAEPTTGGGNGLTGGAGTGTATTTSGGGAGSSIESATGGAPGSTGGAGPGAGGVAAGGGGSGGSRAGASGAGSGGRGGGGGGGRAGTAGMGGTGAIDAGPRDASEDVHVADVASSGAVFAVGTFVKSATAGPQVVPHTLGRAPKALVLWTVGAMSASPGTDAIQAMGVSDGLLSSMATAMASHGGVTPSSSSRRIAPKAITLARWDLTTLAEADLTAWDQASFTLDWSVNGDTPYPVHYAVIGGDAVSSKVVSWQTPTITGVKAVAGVGFQPDVVLHFHSGWFFTSTPPATITNAGFGLGMMDRAGGQCAIHVRASDAKNPTLTARAQRTDASLYVTHEVGPIVTKQASFVSMDGDGFTMNFTTSNSSASQIFSLALSGLTAKVGSFMKTTGTAPIRQPIVGTGYKPGLVLFSSVQDGVESAITVDQMRFGFGAVDGAHEAASALFDTHGVSPSVAASIDFADTAFVKMNNATAAVEARADVQSLDADGFTLDWTANDAVATQLCYLALGSR